MISTNIIVLHSLYSPMQVPFFGTEVENKKNYRSYWCHEVVILLLIKDHELLNRYNKCWTICFMRNISNWDDIAKKRSTGYKWLWPRWSTWGRTRNCRYKERSCRQGQVLSSEEPSRAIWWAQSFLLNNQRRCPEL